MPLQRKWVIQAEDMTIPKQSHDISLLPGFKMTWHHYHPRSKYTPVSNRTIHCVVSIIDSGSWVKLAYYQNYSNARGWIKALSFFPKILSLSVKVHWQRTMAFCERGVERRLEEEKERDTTRRRDSAGRPGLDWGRVRNVKTLARAAVCLVGEAQFMEA